MSNDTTLAGKSVLITGASRGIGAAAAQYLADMGAKLILVARSEKAISELADKINQRGGNAIARAADVSDFASVEAIIKEANESWWG
jgi:NADP-dependent 3-hydroxy acid dehydrogenase YdfG